MLDRRQRQRRTAGLSRTSDTATGGLLARGAAAKIATLHGRLSAGVVFPGASGCTESLADGVVVEPGVLEELAPARIVAGPLDPEVDGAPHRLRGVPADVVAEQVMGEEQVPGRNRQSICPCRFFASR